MTEDALANARARIRATAEVYGRRPTPKEEVLAASLLAGWWAVLALHNAEAASVVDVAPLAVYAIDCAYATTRRETCLEAIRGGPDCAAAGEITGRKVRK